MTFFLRNLILLHILLVVWFFTWVHGGTRSEHLLSVPWLIFLLLNAMLMLPTCRSGETLPEARRRVWRRIWHDPLLWLSLALTVLLLAQWGNGLSLDSSVEASDSRPAINRWIPFSIGDAVRQPLYWFPPVLVVLLAARHALSRQGRRQLIGCLAWGGACLSAFGWIQAFSGTTSLYWMTPLPGYFFATFGYENHAGELFTLLFSVSGGLWFQAVMDKDVARRSWRMLCPVILNLAGVLGSHSRAAILLSLLILVVGGLACILSAWGWVPLASRIKGVTFAVLLALLSVGLYGALPKLPVCAELATVRPATLYQDTIGARLFLFRSAWAMACDYPVFGVGGWGYRELVHNYVTPTELTQMQQGKGMANVHNDALQFMTEHGVIGLGLLLGVVGVMLRPILQGIWRVLRTVPVVDWDNPYVPMLMRVPAPVYAILAGTTATVIHSMIDLPFRSPAVLITWALCLACAPAFLPLQAVTPNTRPATPVIKTKEDPA